MVFEVRGRGKNLSFYGMERAIGNKISLDMAVLFVV
jgi:hypothetical protein